MPFVINGFNVGQDISISIQDDTGVVVDSSQLGHLMEIDATMEDTELRVIPISNNGLPLFDTLYHGWSGRMTFTRMNGALDNLLTALENNFFNTGRRQKFTLNCTILNRDGSVDQYVFTQVTLSRGGFGNFRADKEVDQVFSFRAQNLINTSGVVPPVGA